jgi:phosphoglycolate phosphatase-like HAD superfamily hydrolase
VLTYDLLKRFGKPPSFKTVKAYFQSRYCGQNFNGFIRNEKWILNISILKKLFTNYTLSIVTGRPRRETDYILNKFKVRKFFSTIITYDDLPGRYQKPHPAGILRALRINNSISGIYFGDNPDDMVAGKRTGIMCVGVFPPQNRSRLLQKALRKSGASVILPNINKIQEVL